MTRFTMGMFAFTTSCRHRVTLAWVDLLRYWSREALRALLSVTRRRERAEQTVQEHMSLHQHRLTNARVGEQYSICMKRE